MTDVRDREITRLRRRLRENRTLLADALGELTARPSAAADAEPEFTDAEIRHMHAQFAPPTGEACPDCGRIHPGPCQTCGGVHGRACPRVRSIEYTTQGDKILIRRVEYWPDGRWDTSGIMFADQLPPLPGEDQGATPSE